MPAANGRSAAKGPGAGSGSAERTSGRDARARDTLMSLLAPVVQDAGLDLEDLQVTPAGRRRLVRVVVDGDDGVSLDAVAAVSQAVSAALDSTPEADAALGGSPYVLEVSSPGVDRPLTEPRHWRRAIGRLVAVTGTDGTQATGRLTGHDPAAATVVLTADGAERVVELAAVARARVQVEFSRPDAGTEDSDSDSDSDDSDSDDSDSDSDSDNDNDNDDSDDDDADDPHHGDGTEADH